jgi:hypothetical protein
MRKEERGGRRDAKEGGRKGDGNRIWDGGGRGRVYDEVPYSTPLKDTCLIKISNHVGKGDGVKTVALMVASHSLRIYACPAGISPPPTEEEAASWICGCIDGTSWKY